VGGLRLKIAYQGGGTLPQTWPGFAKRRQHFGQHLIGCNQVATGEAAADGYSDLVPLVFAVGDRHPKERIGKYSLHGDGGRFGVP
jgi:hypothetical protein